MVPVCLSWHGGCQEKWFYFQLHWGGGEERQGKRLSKPILSDILHVFNLLKVLHLPKQGPNARKEISNRMAMTGTDQRVCLRSEKPKENKKIMLVMILKNLSVFQVL